MTLSHKILTPIEKIYNFESSAYNIFAFPFAGASAEFYAGWNNFFPKKITFLPIQLPGRSWRCEDPLIDNVKSMVKSIYLDLKKYLIKRPFAFFGHSMGALLAFELTRFLQKETTLLPDHLFLSGHQHPSNPRKYVNMHLLDNESLIKKMISFGGTSKEIFECSEMTQLLLPVIRSDFKLCETYKYYIDDPLNCSLEIFTGTDDEMVVFEYLKAWKAETSKECNFHEFSGNHFYLSRQKGKICEIIIKKVDKYL